VKGKGNDKYKINVTVKMNLCTRLNLLFFNDSAHKGRKVVIPTFRPPLSPENIAGTYFV